MDYNSSEMAVGRFNDEYRNGTLIIKPPFQRKPVWAARQKCHLIETILLRLPIPEIYIQQTTTEEGKTTLAIVDGQQRIRSVLQFIGSDRDSDQQDFNKFALDKLSPQSSFKNTTFEELTADQKRAFFGYRFAIRYLNTESDTEIRDMFRRLNEFGAPLRPQELRNATYGGPFTQLAAQLAEEEYWAENRIVTPAAIRRMNDVEFVSELLIGVLHGPQGGSSKIIDEYYKNYEDFEDEFPEQRRVAREFDTTLATIKTFYPDIKNARWSNKTDFYTLFVALAALLRTHDLPKNSHTQLRKELEAFGEEINLRLGNNKARVRAEALTYVRAVEKGANDKARRAERHAALTDVIEPFFKTKKS